MTTISGRLIALAGGMVTVALLLVNPAWANGRDEMRERLARQTIQALMAQPDAPIEIRLADGTTQRGRPKPLGSRSFLLVDDGGRQTQIPYHHVTRSRRLPAGKVVAGAAEAVGVATAVCSEATGSPICFPPR